MAVVAGNIEHLPEQVTFASEPLSWVKKHLTGAFASSRRNPSRFPDRVWSRHSALLDSAWKQSQQGYGE